ncbi:MAG TPA: hypothetical protein VMI12_14265 [Puia sp.]|nr:hypothetical protein [Puia sp.]
MVYLFWKNKGLLVLLYFIICVFVTAEIVGILHRNTTGFFSNIDFYTTIGFSFLFSSVWTYFTKDSYYKDRDGNKKKVDTVNEFFFLSMKTWAYIYLGAALVFFGNLVFHYFGKVE